MAKSQPARVSRRRNPRASSDFMSDEEFNKLLNGPLHHPLGMFVITRLTMALRHVVEATGEAGEKALLEWCEVREQQDHLQD